MQSDKEKCMCFGEAIKKKGGKSHFNLMEADLWVRGIISEKTNPPDMAEQTPPEAAAAAAAGTGISSEGKRKLKDYKQQSLLKKYCQTSTLYWKSILFI